MIMPTTRRRRATAALAGISAGVAVLWIIATSGGTLPFGEFASQFQSAGPGSRALDYVRRSLATSYDTSQNEVIPSFYTNFANVWDTTITVQDQPLFWYVPKAGGATLAKVFSYCLDMVTASSLSIESPPDELAINLQSNGGRYLNVDPSTAAGISRAIALDAVQNRAAKVFLTHRLFDSAPMFSSSYRGRLFVMLRHPVKRAQDNFFYRQRATWEEDFDPELATMSLLEYSKSDKLVTNYVVRTLLNHQSEDVTAADVVLAKAVLRRKFLVGIMEWYERSVVRYERYFGWWNEFNILSDQEINHCHYKEISKEGSIYPQPENKAETYDKLAVRNWADMELYMYAKNLFNQQAVLID